jgi:transcriptional regulator with XRE-family HTH domain
MHGIRLKEERTRLELTQPQIAEKCGVGKNTVINWEKDASSPNAPQLSALSDLGVDVMYLLSGKRSQGIDHSIDRVMKAVGITGTGPVQELKDLGNILGISPTEALNVVRETASHYGMSFSEAIDASIESAAKPRGPNSALASLSKDVGSSKLSNDERELIDLFRAAPLQLKMQVVNALASGHMPQTGGVSVHGNNNQAAGRDAFK